MQLKRLAPNAGEPRQPVKKLLGLIQIIPLSHLQRKKVGSEQTESLFLIKASASADEKTCFYIVRPVMRFRQAQRAIVFSRDFLGHNVSWTDLVFRYLLETFSDRGLA